MFLKNIFQRKKKNNDIPLNEIRFVVFDTETTGFDFSSDRILSIGAVTLFDNKIEIKNNLEIFLQQEKSNPESIPIHGIIKNHKNEKLSENEALIVFLEYINDAVLVGHHVGFDIKMINMALLRNGLLPLKNKAIDTNYLFKKTKIINYLLQNDKNYSLDEICQELNITTHDRHNASGDAFLTAIAFLKILNKLSNTKKINTINALLRI